MNNYNFTQSLDGLNNIEADTINTSNLNIGSLVVNTAKITTLSDCNLVNCTTDTPLNPTSAVNKSYVDNNFVDRTNNLTQSINGLKTFTNNTNFTGTATFNSIPICSTNATANNQIVNWQTLNGQSFTTLALVQSNANTFSSTNTFSNTINANGQINLKNNLLIYDLVGLTNYHRIYQSGQDFSITPTGGSSSTISLSCLNSGGSNVQSLLLNSTQVSVPINLSVAGTTNFSSSLPTCSVVPSSGSQLVNKTYTDSTFQLISNMSNYVDTTTSQSISGIKTFNSLPLCSVVPSSGSQLVNKTYTDSIYQTISGMSSYLTTASASSTYQTISGMSSYLTTASASSTYQTISGMSSYLTTASASSTYQTQVVGSIIMLAMGTVPSGYLECNGQSVSNSTYGALFTAIGYTYGGSYPSAIFLLPDFRGMFLRGKGTNGTNSDYSSSSSYGFMQSDIIKSHSHNIKFGYNTAYQGTGGSYNAFNSTQPSYNNPGGKIGDLGTGRANGETDNNITGNLETRPGNFPVFYCIKY